MSLNFRRFYGSRKGTVKYLVIHCDNRYEESFVVNRCRTRNYLLDKGSMCVGEVDIHFVMNYFENKGQGKCVSIRH